MPKINRPGIVSENGHASNGAAHSAAKMLPCEVPGFKYRGGKYKLRRQIIRFCRLNGHTFVEPYAGRANMMLLMRVVGDYQRWVLNDLSTVDFLQAIKDYNGRHLPHLGQEDIGGRSGYDMYAYKKHPDQEAILLMEPMLFWSGGRRGMSTPAGRPFGDDPVAYDNYRERLLKAKALLTGVELHQRDASGVIEEFGASPDNFLYVDPPYLDADVGCYKDGGRERKRMIAALSSAKCKWLMSEYLCDDLISEFGEPVAEIPNIVDLGTKGGDRRVELECLYANYKAELKPFDFGDSQKLIPLTMSLLKKAGGKVDWETWDKICPPHWKRQTREDQFKKLAKQPNVYYNCKDIVLVSSK